MALMMTRRRSVGSGIGKTVTTAVRLFDRYPDTGFKFMAYPAGSDVPIDEYERLRKLNDAPLIEKPRDPEPEPPKEQPLAEMTKASLLVKAAELGVRVNPRNRKDDIRQILEEEIARRS